jgi:hypothetical protein
VLQVSHVRFSPILVSRLQNFFLFVTDVAAKIAAAFVSDKFFQVHLKFANKTIGAYPYKSSHIRKHYTNRKKLFKDKGFSIFSAASVTDKKRGL